MNAHSAGFRFSEISTADDPDWVLWRDIYYASFPESELMSEGHFLRVLGKKSQGDAPHKHILALRAQGSEEPLTGIAYYEDEPEANLAFLWYLATRSSERNRGYGTHFYREICGRAREKGAAMLVYEVEIPKLAAEISAEDGVNAARRIRWYQQLGASVLDGVHYVQGVDTGVPPIEMHLMVHPFQPMEVDDIYALCKISCGTALDQVGDLGLLGAAV